MTQPAQMRSRLAGVWEPVEGPRDKLIIRTDGTFDLRYTLWVAAGDVGRLRKAGDVLDRPDIGMRAEVVHSEYKPALSYMVLKMTQRGDEGQLQTGYGQYYARLAPDGDLMVRIGPLPAADSPPEALAEWAYRHVGDAPEPPPPIGAVDLPKPDDDEWVAYGRRIFHATNWLAKVHVRRVGGNVLNGFLITPRDEERAHTFLVVSIHPEPIEGEWVKSAVSNGAYYAAVGGCSYLLLTIPEIEPYQRYPEERVAELVGLVLAEVRKVISAARPRACGLVTNGNGTYLGHYIWQKDNTIFGAWFCWDPDYFQWYGEMPQTDARRPAMMRSLPHPSEFERRKVESVVKEYQDHGLRNVQAVEFGQGEADWEKRLIELLMTAATDGTTKAR